MPLTARTMVVGTASIRQSDWAQGTIRSWDLQASARPFVTDHWQLGISPAYGGNDGPSLYQTGGLALLADWGTDIPWGLRAYIGAYASGTSATTAKPWGRYGWRAGVMRFLSPSAALRAELRDYAWSTQPSIAAERMLVVSLDQYFVRGGPPETGVPTLGSVDIDALAGLARDPARYGRIRAGVAPFVTRWLQVGGRMDAVRYYDGNGGAHAYDGFLRLYAPLSLAFEPFVGGNLEWSTWGSDGGGLSYVDALVGARHSVQRAMAVDAGLQLRTNRPQRGLPRTPNELTVFGRVVLTANWRAAAH